MKGMKEGNTPRQLVLNRIASRKRGLRQALDEAERKARAMAMKACSVDEHQKRANDAFNKAQRMTAASMKSAKQKHEAECGKLDKLREQAMFARTEELKKIYDTLK